MSYSTFTERTNKPSQEDIFKVLSTKLFQWKEIDSYLVDMIGAKSIYKFYGKNYGWAIGFSKNSKNIISLFPLVNDFTILFISKKENEEEIIEAVESQELKNLIKNTPAIKEGKWLFIEYSKINSIEIVKKMINIKLL